MKFKALTLVMMSSVLLSACGGGESSKDNNSSVNNNLSVQDQEWSEINIYSDNDFNRSIDTQIGYGSDMLTIKNNKVYSKLVSEYDWEDYESIKVTKTGLYDNSNELNDLGKYLGTITGSNNQWIISPYSSVNSTGLKFTTIFNSKNLENKSIAEIVMPFEYWIAKNELNQSFGVPANLLDFLLKLNEDKFPSGAVCIQINEEKVNEPYLELETYMFQDDYIKSEWEKIDNSFKAKDSSITELKYFNTQAYSVYDKEFDESWVIAQFKKDGKTTYHYTSETPAGVEYSRENELNEMIDWIDYSGEDTAAQMKQEYVDYFKNSCNMYNKVAYNFIVDKITEYNEEQIKLVK